MTIFLVILNTILVITQAVLAYKIGYSNGYKSGVLDGFLIGNCRHAASSKRAAKLFPKAQKLIDEFSAEVAWKLSQDEL